VNHAVNEPVQRRQRLMLFGVPLFGVLVEGALVVSWSSGFVGVRFAIDQAPLFGILFWRSLVSGLLLLPFALTIGPRLRWRASIGQALFGALAMGGYLAGFASAIDLGVPTGLVALITDMLPLAVAALSWPILGQALSARQWLGSAIGLGGLLIASAHAITLGHVPLWSYGLPVIATLSLALGVLLQKRYQAVAMPVHQSLCIQCLAAAAAFAGPAWRDGGLAPVPDLGFVAGVLWLVLFATFGAWTLYYLALRKSSPARVTAVLYLSPPVTMIWAGVMFGESLHWAMAAGLIVSLVGVALVVQRPRGAP
jgi:drug/metabolite transporter (DMT)-like permease